MSLHVSVVSIAGDRLSEIADVLERLQYRIEKVFHVETGEAVSVELDWHPDQNRVAKAVYTSDGWTHVIDPELVLMNDDVWLEYSDRWQTMVVGWVCEGASGSYGLTVFEGGSRLREVFTSSGEILSDSGGPLDEEMDLDWSEADEGDVLAVAERLGSEYDLADRDYMVLHLDESGITLPG